MQWTDVRAYEGACGFAERVRAYAGSLRGGGGVRSSGAGTARSSDAGDAGSRGVRGGVYVWGGVTSSSV
jgi:hypothetical protein